MDHVDLSKAKFADGFNCSQSVLLAFAEELGLEPGMAARLASPFGGGVSRSGRLCGAVSGALLVLGLRYGNSEGSDRGAKEATYALARHYMEQFTSRQGALDCPDLLGCDIGTPEGVQQAREKNLFKERCTELVADAVRILLTLEDGKTG